MFYLPLDGLSIWRYSISHLVASQDIDILSPTCWPLKVKMFYLPLGGGFKVKMFFLTGWPQDKDILSSTWWPQDKDILSSTSLPLKVKILYLPPDGLQVNIFYIPLVASR